MQPPLCLTNSPANFGSGLPDDLRQARSSQFQFTMRWCQCDRAALLQPQCSRQGAMWLIHSHKSQQASPRWFKPTHLCEAGCLWHVAAASAGHILAFLLPNREGIQIALSRAANAGDTNAALQCSEEHILFVPYRLARRCRPPTMESLARPALQGLFSAHRLPKVDSSNAIQAFPFGL